MGADKNFDQRQLAAVEAFAARQGFTIAGTIPARLVEDDISSRPGFSAMLDALEANGTRIVIRKLLLQEARRGPEAVQSTGRVDRFLIDQQRVDDAAHLDELLPVSWVEHWRTERTALPDQAPSKSARRS